MPRPTRQRSYAIPGTILGAKVGELGPTTRVEGNHGHYLNLIRNQFGDLRMKDLRPRAVAALQWHYANRPGQANYFVAVLRILLNFAVKQRLIITNPAENSVG
ncbi:MAG: hypothetical protein WDN25_05370 [Acetobacteraceae bacterium]